ncbi:MAG: thiamine pyrophosphate-binding protein [Nostocoides sp.]
MPVNSRQQTHPLYAQAVIDGLHRAGATVLIHVPDSILAPIIALAEEDDRFLVINASREEEAFGIAAGVSAGGGRTALLIQASGLGNSLNALGSMVLPFRVAVPVILSPRGEIGDRNWAQVAFGSAVPAILDLLSIQSLDLVDERQVADAVFTAADSAYRWNWVVVATLTRALTGGANE